MSDQAPGALGGSEGAEPAAPLVSPSAATPAPAAAPDPPRKLFALPLRAGVAYALAALSGFVYFLGFPGANLWPLAFVSQVPLLLALRGQSPKRAAGLGLTAGFVISVTGFYWLLGMLRVFSGFPTVICLGIMALMCAWQGGRTALLGWLYARAEARGWPPSLVFTLAFATSELVYPLLFPWYAGASFYDTPIFLQVADLGGPYLIGVVLLGPSLAIAEAILARLEQRKLSRAVIAAGLALPMVGAIYGAIQLRRVDAMSAAAPAIKIGIAQANQPLVGRRLAVPTHLRLSEKLKQQGAELVIWSEGSIPGVFPEPIYKDKLRDEVTEKLGGVPAIVGAALRRVEGTTRRSYNSALLINPEGEPVGRYDKQFLLAFGEYLPFGDIFPILYKWSPHSGHFAKGESLEPLIFGEHRISALICYEDILPSFVNRMVNHADPDLLVNLTNDAWFGPTTEPLEHFALAQIRAVEHRRYLIRATNSGLSGIIDAAGRIAVRGGIFREEALIGTARFMRSKTVYEVIGDAPFWLGALAIGAMAFARRKKAEARA